MRSYLGGMSFKSHEIEFLRQADLGRLATIQPDGTPQNSPVGFTYNESLGTVSDSYMYDRVKDRDLPESKRPQRAWDKPAVPVGGKKA